MEVEGVFRQRNSEWAIFFFFLFQCLSALLDVSHSLAASSLALAAIMVMFTQHGGLTACSRIKLIK